MKKTILMVISVLMIGSLMGCNSKNKSTKEGAILLTEEESLKTEKIISFITDMYISSKYEDNDFLKAHCSDAVFKKLREDYDFDDGGLATWDFRSDAQDGPSDRHEIVSVTPLDDDWYRYEFYDMGIKGSHMIKIVIVNNKYLIDGLK